MPGTEVYRTIICKGSIMPPKTVRAHFDGEHIRLDEPCLLEPDAPLLVLVLPTQHDADEHADWIRLSQQALANAYGEDEPEYSVDTIIVPNPDYARR